MPAHSVNKHTAVKSAMHTCGFVTIQDDVLYTHKEMNGSQQHVWWCMEAGLNSSDIGKNRKDWCPLAFPALICYNICFYNRVVV